MKSVRQGGIFSTGLRLTEIWWRGGKEKTENAKEKKKVLELRCDHTVPFTHNQTLSCQHWSCGMLLVMALCFDGINRILECSFHYRPFVLTL